jgi:mRNA deadenylase 3'-5' endonuclease subunit Ccr4
VKIVDYVAHTINHFIRFEHPGADVVCLQEVSPVSFDEDFAFMQELGYDGKEMFKKGRFRPATFWKSAQCELVSPPVHKDRTLLTAFRINSSLSSQNWYILNCHLQAGKEGKRRLRQIDEGVRAVQTLARKLKGRYHLDGIRLC